MSWFQMKNDRFLTISKNILMDYYNRRKIMVGCRKISGHEKMTKNKKGGF